jgi:hypothetical protein
MKINFKAIFGNQMWVLKFQTMVVPKAGTVGMCSRIPHTLEHIPMLDYEPVIEDERLKDELKGLQGVFHLGDGHVVETYEYGRHAVFFDRMLTAEVLEVIYSSSCDPIFRPGIRYNEYRTWVTRIFEKGERDRPHYLYRVDSPHNGERLQSQAHALFFERFYGAKVRLTNPDGNTSLLFQSYRTSSKVKLEDLLKEKNVLKGQKGTQSLPGLLREEQRS